MLPVAKGGGSCHYTFNQVKTKSVPEVEVFHEQKSALVWD